MEQDECQYNTPVDRQQRLNSFTPSCALVLGLPNGKVGPNEGSNRVMLRTHVIVPHVTWKTLFIPWWKRIVVTAAAIIVVFGCYTGNRFTMINTVKG
jgi:hypothetical protein